MEEKIRNPAVAGTFYPANPGTLKKSIEEFLARVELPSLKGEIIGGICPHAGYIYSGQAQAYVYKAFQEKEFSTAIIIASSHSAYYEGASIYPEGFYRTPLGEVKIDSELAGNLLKYPHFQFIPHAHLREHSVEVQLPFLQVIKKTFSFLPIVISEFSEQTVREIAESIYMATQGKDVVFIASSDLSHYPPYRIAKKVDRETINRILSLNPSKLHEFAVYAPRHYPGVSTAICGEGAVLTLLNLLPLIGGNKAQLLVYYNSGDVAGGMQGEVVGYSGIVFLKE